VLKIKKETLFKLSTTRLAESPRLIKNFSPRLD